LTSPPHEGADAAGRVDARAAEADGLPAPDISIGRLPVTSRDLFGREAELAWLDECWAEGVYVASIIAWGGVGKSALVNAWLARLRDAGWPRAEKVFGWSFYSQGTDRLSSSDEFIDVALRWFGDVDPKVGSPWDKGERLASLVRKQRTLLVLDGVEPLQWGPGVEQGKLKDPALQALVKELGAQNMGLCLITSRIAVTDLEALGGSKVQAHGLDHLSAEAGAELLRARGAKGSEEELRAAAKEYDGHSFALTLLGTYIRNAHKGDIRKRVHIPLEGKPAHRMMATYERWFQNMPQLAILRMLGLFDRPAPEDEIAVLRAEPVIPGLTDALAGLTQSAWNEAVTALRDVRLLAESDMEETERLDAHPLVREYFGEQLWREQPEAWREGHRRLYEHLKEKAKPLPDTIEEMAPLYAAVVHGCLAGLNREAEREVYRKRIRRGNEYFSTKKLGAFGSEVAVLSAFFDPPWERLAPGLSEPDQALVLNNTGAALGALGRLPEAAGLMRRGLDPVIAMEEWKRASAGASNLSEILQARGELREALEQAGKSVELADKSGAAFMRMGNRTTLAAAQLAMGLREEAAAQFEEAERMQKERQPAYPLLYSLAGFRYCDLLLDQGREADVRERAARMLASIRPWYSLLAIALDHLSLGRAHLLAAERGAGGDLPQAASHLADSVNGLRRAGYQKYLPLGFLARAALHTHTRAFALARKDLDEAFSIATRSGFRLHETDAHLGYARLSLAEGPPASARPHLAEARKLIEATGYHRRDGELAALERALAAAFGGGAG
jgi:tetratricopeptide (TPR) repeat protein